jgi:hypothetical protein
MRREVEATRDSRTEDGGFPLPAEGRQALHEWRASGGPRHKKRTPLSGGVALLVCCRWRKVLFC